LELLYYFCGPPVFQQFSRNLHPCNVPVAGKVAVAARMLAGNMPFFFRFLPLACRFRTAIFPPVPANVPFGTAGVPDTEARVPPE
jgi:hypothetical protein